jgi:methylmalonyl-CoA/ethylmalonyl-CoA epimerase
MREPLFTETLQVSIVVRDLDAAMRTYVREYGIGPWDVYEFNAGTVSDMRHRGEPVAWSWQLAIAQVGQVQWELVEPLDDESIYAQFLADHGPGVHHVGVGVAGYDDTLAELAGRGQDVLLSGGYKGLTFAYLSTHDDLGAITEIFSGAPGEDQKPDRTYPPSA